MPMVLLVDDDPQIYTSFQANLGDEFEFLHAPDKHSGMTLLADQDVIIDLCLIDYYLPDGDGLELVKHAKSGTRPIPVIFITGYPSLELSTQALSLDYGADYFLSKPVDLYELKRCMWNCLQLKEEKNNYNYRKKSSAKRIETKNKKKREETHRKRENRLNNIVKLIESKPKHYTKAMLAAKLSVSPTQILHDLQRLEERGNPIKNDGKGYFLDEN